MIRGLEVDAIVPLFLELRGEGGHKARSEAAALVAGQDVDMEEGPIARGRARGLLVASPVERFAEGGGMAPARIADEAQRDPPQHAPVEIGLAGLRPARADDIADRLSLVLGYEAMVRLEPDVI